MDHETAKLISLVKSRPALYTYKAKRGKNKTIMNQYWKEIAFEMNCSELDCKRKWAILRNCYARSLREERKQKIKRKPWYLQKNLSFLRRYIHPHRKQKGDGIASYLPDDPNAPDASLCIDIESSSSPPDINQSLLTDLSHCSTELFESEDSKVFPPVAVTLISPEQPMPMADVKNFFPEHPKYEEPAAGDGSNFSTITVKSSPKTIKDHEPVTPMDDVAYNEAANSNHLFLTSLLPDLNKLSEKKQRVFKRKTIELLEILFEADDDFLTKAKLNE